ncbi:hypothetical protein [Halalkalicoccus salilacus]|uniref:hypothetical protein n=1 Tax=Halalkalicoccus sp. GCM10025704 TaxID=3252662 RepID=UPI00360F60B9
MLAVDVGRRLIEVDGDRPLGIGAGAPVGAVADLAVAPAGRGEDLRVEFGDALLGLAEAVEARLARRVAGVRVVGLAVEVAVLDRREDDAAPGGFDVDARRVGLAAEHVRDPLADGALQGRRLDLERLELLVAVGVRHGRGVIGERRDRSFEHDGGGVDRSELHGQLLFVELAGVVRAVGLAFALA